MCIVLAKLNEWWLEHRTGVWQKGEENQIHMCQPQKIKVNAKYIFAKCIIAKPKAKKLEDKLTNQNGPKSEIYNKT